MTEKKRVLVIAGVALAVYFSIKYLLPYVIPFLIAWILVKALNPLLRKIRRKLPWKKEVLISILVFFLFFLTGILVYYLYKAITEQIYSIISNFDHYYHRVGLFLDDCCVLLERKTGVNAIQVRSLVNRGLESLQVQMNGTWIPGILNHSLQYIMGLVKLVGYIFIIYVAILLLMKDYDRIKENLEQYELYKSVKNVTDRIFQIGGTYLRSQFVIMAIVTILCIVGLYFLKNPYALLLGLVTGVLDALPFLGTGMILLPMAVVYLLQKEFWTAAGYGLLFLAATGAREFLEPKLVGERIGIYPFAFALSVYAGICLFGPTGIFTGPIGIILIMEISREWLKSSKD